MTVVSNSSPLIALHYLRRVGLCTALFGTVVKPLVDQLLSFGFHADEDLVAAVLRIAGESAA